MKVEFRSLHSEHEGTKSTTVALEKDLEKARQDKVYAEQRMQEALQRMKEAEERCTAAEKSAKYATEIAESAREAATTTEKEKLESQKLAVERLASIERIERHCETLEREKVDLGQVKLSCKLSY